MPIVGAVQYCNSGGRIWFEVEVVEAQGGLLVGLMGTNARKQEDLAKVVQGGMAWLVVHEGDKDIAINGRVPPVALGPCSCTA